MAWNTEETRRRLKEAAVVEFAASGLAGARMEKIAERAGINKERLYRYFGDKDQLFATVLADEMARITAALPAGKLVAEDPGEYAGRCYDYHVEHPHLLRLLLWEALDRGSAEVSDELARTEHYRRKVASYPAHDAETESALGPAHVMFIIMAMAAWWEAVPQVARMMTGVGQVTPQEHARRRSAVVEAARRLTA
jgi:AcrR family transcriptional regulator